MNPPTNGPLHLERPSLDTVLHPPTKGVVQKSTFNPHARATQNYSIVEDLAQAPSAMSALEVLHTFPIQRKTLLKSIGGIDPTDTNLIFLTWKITFQGYPLNSHSKSKLLSPTKTFVEQLLMRVP
jgi:hypothetical protein